MVEPPIPLPLVQEDGLDLVVAVRLQDGLSRKLLISPSLQIRNHHGVKVLVGPVVGFSFSRHSSPKTTLEAMRMDV